MCSVGGDVEIECVEDGVVEWDDEELNEDGHALVGFGEEGFCEAFDLAHGACVWRVGVGDVHVFGRVVCEKSVVA